MRLTTHQVNRGFQGKVDKVVVGDPTNMEKHFQLAIRARGPHRGPRLGFAPQRWEGWPVSDCSQSWMVDLRTAAG